MRNVVGRSVAVIGIVGRVVAAGAASAAILGLAACDGGGSAVASRDHSAVTDVTMASLPAQGAAVARADAPAVDPRTQPVRKVDGKPVWAPNRQLTADEAAAASFERNGAEFEAKSVDDWVGKVHDFVDKPPRGATKITRVNGDVLIYDAKTNVFAVATKDGAPRTMFKPREGAAYWDKQKATETARLAKADKKASDES
jgi:pyocin large subunit-like protein